MSTVTDLYTELSKMRGLDFGELRHLARSLQTTGLLPKANRQQRLNPPPINAKHCAIFLIGIAVARTSGGRVPEKLKRRINLFKKLEHERSDGARINLFDHLTTTIEQYRDTAWLKDSSRKASISKIIFVVDDEIPEAIFHEIFEDRVDENDVPIAMQLSFAKGGPIDFDASIDASTEYCADAFHVHSGIFYRFRALLGPLTQDLEVQFG